MLRFFMFSFFAKEKAMIGNRQYFNGLKSLIGIFSVKIKCVSPFKIGTGAALVSIMLLNTGCAVHKTMQAVGGSRSDGVVKMAYTYEAFESPIVNEKASQARAAQRCRAWGYADAQPFGGGQRQCIRPSLACEEYQVTVEYQCTGGQAGMNMQPHMAAPMPARAQNQYIQNAGQNAVQQNNGQNGNPPVQQIIINVPAAQGQGVSPANR